MNKFFNIIQDNLKSFLKRLQTLPRVVWILVLAVFIAGFIIRGGGSNGKIYDPAAETEAVRAEVWTCAMHPQIRLPEPGQCPICFMDLIPLKASDSAEGPRELKMSPAAMKLAEISTMIVRRGVAEKTVPLSGKVTTDETRIGKITAWVPGRLEKLYADNTGITVTKGEPLVELYSPELYTAQEELLQALNQNVNQDSKLAVESARMMQDAAREKLRQLGLTGRQIQEMENRGSASDRMIIASPLSGVVTHKNALKGLWVKQGEPIYTIADLSSVWVVLDAYESDLIWIKENQTAEFTVEAVPGQTFTGKVIFINPILDEKTRTVQVRINADNSGGLLKPGMFVRASIKTSLEKNKDGSLPLLVPVSAVLKTGKRSVVYIKKPDTEEPVFEGREIIAGARAGDFYIVLSGLEEGEEVVTKGNFKIDSAMQIMAKPSMMNPEGGATVTGHEHHAPGETPEPSRQKSTEKEIKNVLPAKETSTDHLDHGKDG